MVIGRLKQTFGHTAVIGPRKNHAGQIAESPGVKCPGEPNKALQAYFMTYTFTGWWQTHYTVLRILHFLSLVSSSSPTFHSSFVLACCYLMTVQGCSCLGL